MSVAVDKFDYQLPYEGIFGGVSAISVKHFNFVNGFSNQFWGWGGEDDDMSKRLTMNNLEVTRYSPDIARWDRRQCSDVVRFRVMLRYTMIKHGMDSGNEVNDGRNQLLEVSHTFQRTDGLSNLK